MTRLSLLAFAIALLSVHAERGDARGAACVDLGISKVFASNWGDVTLEQHGCRVTGRYVYADGHLDGSLDGNMLRYAWKSNEGSGHGVFVVATNGELVGTWGSDTDDTNGGGWRLVPTAATSSIAR